MALSPTGQCSRTLTLAKETHPLITTAGQDQWTENYGTQWRELWKNMNTHLKKVRAPVASFIWRLLNRTIPWATHKACPLCQADKASINHLFLECPSLNEGFEDPPLSLIITPPHKTNINMLLGVWAQWKTLCWVVHTPGLQVSKVDVEGIIQNNYFQELERAQATG